MSTNQNPNRSGYTPQSAMIVSGIGGLCVGGPVGAVLAIAGLHPAAAKAVGLIVLMVVASLIMRLLPVVQPGRTIDGREIETGGEKAAKWAIIAVALGMVLAIVYGISVT